MEMKASSVADSKTQQLWLDWAEKALLLTLYTFFCIRILSAVRSSHWLIDLMASLPVLVGEALVLVFALIRVKPQTISMRPRDWFLALTATCLPLLVAPDSRGPPPYPTIFFIGMVLALGFQIYAKISLGRSFGLVAANRGLKFQGPYRWVRHPIYAGYLLMHATYLFGHPTLRNLLVYLCFYALQLPRIAAEERLLAEDQEYRDYSKVVKYRLIPWLY
jgi:protein-S-isoprenylcysteine O-methyltransferase Ste14